MKRVSLWALSIVLLIAISAFAYWRPDRALEVASGLMAHNVCSATFISNLDPEATANELVKPMLPGFVGPLFRVHVDRERQAVDASVAGLKAMRAKFSPGYGCRLVLDPRYRDPVPPSLRVASAPDSFAPSTEV